MARILAWAAGVLAALLAQACLAAPLEAYGRLPALEAAAISPDGQFIAVIATDGEKRNVVITDASDNKVVTGLAAGTTKVRDLKWAGSDHLLITISFLGLPSQYRAVRAEWYFVIDFDVKTHNQRALIPPAEDRLGAIAAPPQVRMIGGEPYAFVEASHFLDGDARISLFKVDLDHASVAPPIDGDPDTNGWLVDAAGAPIAQTEFFPKTGRGQLKLNGAGGWRSVDDGGRDDDTPTLLGLGRDGKSALLEDATQDTVALREQAPDAPLWGPRFAEQNTQDLIFDPVDEHLIGIHAVVDDYDRTRFFDPADQAAWAIAANAYPGRRVTLASLSADHRKLIVLVDSPFGPAYALVDTAAKSAYFIGAVYNGLSAADVAPMRPIAFTAKDGLALTGYLTLPRGRDPKNLPLVVFPHGGPAERDAPGFDWWAQAMAAQGYAVLQVNFRGSDGFGKAFMKAGYGEWGGKMQTDLSDAVRYLAAQGTIEPAKVCIVGASYGGYAALAGATLDPGIYRCAVDVEGPSDLRSFVLWAKDQSDGSAQRYWDRFMGAKDPNDPHLAAVSPTVRAAQAKIPILLIHGREDTVVPFQQSLMMAEALQKTGNPAQLIILKNQDHWLTRGDTRLQMLQATVDFLKKNNPPD